VEEAETDKIDADDAQLHTSKCNDTDPNPAMLSQSGDTDW